MNLFIKKARLELITVAVLLIIASLMIFLSKQALIILVSIILGLFFIGTGILILVTTIKNRHQEEPNLFFLLAQGIVVLTFGICAIVFRTYWLRLVVGVLMIVYAVLKIIIASNKKSQIFKELPKTIIGLVLVLSLEAIIKLVFLILGIIIFVLCGILIFLTIRAYRKNKHNSLFYQFFMNTLTKITSK
ncbi:MAG TPA: DUF308 domain-containing protein [Bacilli bacterium]|nr:DUF308 domain-containing protein [Bacilli bacterium]HQD92410.1 DUF308 domain-containing protein [Bacilli bacterium]